MMRAARRLRPRGPRQPAQDLPRRQGLRRDARAAPPGAAVTPFDEHRRARAHARRRASARGRRRRRRARRRVVDVRATSPRCRRASARAARDGLRRGRRAASARHLDVGGAARARRRRCCASTAWTRVVDHQAADMTVTVEAGCPLARARRRTLGDGRPVAAARSAARRERPRSAACSPRTSRVRSARRRARRATCCSASASSARDGALVSGGGRVVKNVAGYDLPKLHVGALGTLGVIVEATFKVRPRPEREEAVVDRGATRSTQAADAGARRARDLAGRAALARGRPDPASSPTVPRTRSALAVGIGGSPRRWRTRGSSCSPLAAMPAGVEPRRRRRRGAARCGSRRSSVEPAAAVLRAATLPATSATCWRGSSDGAREPDAACAAGHAGQRRRARRASPTARGGAARRAPCVPRSRRAGGRSSSSAASPAGEGGARPGATSVPGLALMRR